MLDLREGKRHKIGNVRQQIQQNDQPGSHGQRQRNIALGIFHFAGGEGDVVPGVGGKERSGLRNADGGEQAERGGGGQAGGDRRQIARRPEARAEIGAHRLRVPSEQQPDQDQAQQRRHLGGRENILDDFPVFKAPRISPGKQHDQQNRDQLRGGKRQRVSADPNRRDDVIGFAHQWHKDAEKSRESHADGGDGSGLNHQQQGPSVKKAP